MTLFQINPVHVNSFTLASDKTEKEKNNTPSKISWNSVSFDKTNTAKTALAFIKHNFQYITFFLFLPSKQK